MLNVCGQEKIDPKIRAYNDALALVSSAQLRVGGVLHIEHPAAHQHCQPCQEQVLYTHEGDPSLSRSERNKHVGTEGGGVKQNICCPYQTSMFS